MAKRESKPKLRKDAAEVAYAVVQAAIGEGPRPEPPGRRVKNPEAVERGRKGGKRGGPNRSSKLSQRRAHLIAKKAARARWHPPKSD